MRRSCEEALSIPDLHDGIEFDLPVGLAWNDLEQVAIRLDWFSRHLPQLGSGQFVLAAQVVFPVDLDYELLLDRYAQLLRGAALSVIRP